jgi:hypothetical protein
VTNRSSRSFLLALLLLAACGPAPLPQLEPQGVVDGGVQLADAGDAFADTVVSFTPGVGAGFGQDRFPQVVFGPPHGEGDAQGSLDVLSLGRGGSIELEFTDFTVADGPGVDFLVFENGFVGFLELGFVEVSDDGSTWSAFPCAALTDGGTEGCAGAHPVYSNPMNGISPTDPSVAGGDGFDLATLGLRTARFVRITDTGTNRFYAPPGGGFDLDAVAVVNTTH